jgi:putative heme-binding domain-containing protein
LALSLGEWDHADAARALARLALAAVEDPWMRTAVVSSSKAHAGVMLETVLREGHVSDGRSQLLQDLISTALGSADRERVAQVLASVTNFETEPELWQIEALASFDRAIRRRDLSLAALRADAEGSLRESLAKADAIMDIARQVAVDLDAPIDRRVVVLPLLGRGSRKQSEDLDTLAALLSPQQPVDVQLAAVRALAQFNKDDIADRLLASWRQLSPQVQSEVLGALLSRRPWHERLLTELEAGRVQVNDLDAPSRARLTSSGNRPLRDRANQLISVATDDPREALERFRGVAQLTGDPVRGTVRFEATCAACHQHNGIGNNFGPQLAALTDKSNEILLTAILDPNRAIENKYKSYAVVTSDGRTLSGMIIAESANSITLAQPNGTQQDLLRVDIEELTSTGLSFMPVGLEKDLSPQDLADLFAFIRDAG